MHNARRLSIVVAVAVLAVLVGVGMAMLSTSRHERTTPSPSPQRTQRVGPEVFRFTSTATKSAYVDNAAKGFSAGDLLTEHTVLSEDGKTVGSMALTSTVTDRTGGETGEVMFTAVADVPHGQLVFSGDFAVVPQLQTFVAAVVGGTGTYSGAQGHAVFKQVSANKTLVTITVTK